MSPPRILVACLAALALVAGCSRRPASGPPATTSAERMPGRAVSFRTADGLRLSGRAFGSGAAGVALAHMYPADATSWYPFARRLAEAGYLVLAFDFRGYRDSEGPKKVADADTDLAAAVAHLRTMGATRIAVVGASMGGTAALAAAAIEPRAAVVALSAPTTFQGLDAESPAPHVQSPVLLLAARGDGPATQSLRTLSGLLPNDEAKLFDGDAHGTNLLLDRPEAGDEILTFLQRHAPAGGAS